MTLFGYAFYNRKVGSYTPVQYEVYDKELKIEMIKRAYVMAKDDQRAQMDECDFYYLGTFDDIKGEIVALDKPEFLLAFGGNKDVGEKN